MTFEEFIKLPEKEKEIYIDSVFLLCDGYFDLVISTGNFEEATIDVINKTIKMVTNYFPKKYDFLINKIKEYINTTNEEINLSKKKYSEIKLKYKIYSKNKKEQKNAYLGKIDINHIEYKLEKLDLFINELNEKLNKLENK